MAYYNNHASHWSASAAVNQTWDSSNHVPRSAGPAANPSPQPSLEAHRPRSAQAGSTEDGDAFYYQFASVDRAVETWRKSSSKPSDSRINMTPRFQPQVDFDPMRTMPSGPPPGPTQSFFAPAPPPPPPPGPSQRFGARSNEPDPAVQAKRRMAAQRERELRNYHQEQQFNKHMPGAKSDRSMSPNTAMSENERRDLIARQHRALYGEDSTLYSGDGAPSRGTVSQDSRVGQRQSRSRGNSNASPSSSKNAYETSQQQTSSSPHGSPPRDTDQSSVAPIGTRPTPTQQQGAPKRSTPPLSSPLGYGFAGDQAQAEAQGGSQEDKSANVRAGWGNSGPWGAKGGLSAQAKVWG